MDHDGSASVSTVVVGGLLLGLALIGRVPSKVHVGDKSIELSDDYTVVIDSVAQHLNAPELQRMAVETLALAADGSPQLEAAARRVSEHAIFKANVLDVVRDVARETGAALLEEADCAWDAELRLGSQVVVLEARLRTDEASAALLSSRVSELDQSVAVVVAGRTFDAAAYQLLASTQRPILLIRWTEGDTPLRSSLKNLLLTP